MNIKEIKYQKNCKNCADVYKCALDNENIYCEIKHKRNNFKQQKSKFTIAIDDEIKQS